MNQKISKWKKILIWSLCILLFIVVSVCISFQFTPWLPAMVIRYAFNQDAEHKNEALKKYVRSDIKEVLNQSYDSTDADALLDVYYFDTLTENAPVIVWVHGGGWVSNNKGHMASYAKILAADGYVVVAIDYSISPENHYPLPVQQTNKALAFLKNNAKRFHIDTLNFFLAGDSGGAQIVAQEANIISDSAYARLVGIAPSLNRTQLSGLLLYCGAYDKDLVKLEGGIGIFLKTVLWSYSGTKDFMADPYFNTMSVLHYVTEAYPPCFISAGNKDFLLEHSLSFTKKLNGLKVKTDTLFFPSDYAPSLSHEYQFNMDTEAGALAYTRSIIFIETMIYNKQNK